MRRHSYGRARKNCEGRPRVESVCTRRRVVCVANDLFTQLRRSGWAVLQGLFDAAGIVYLLAIREFFATPRFPRRVVVIGLVLAAVWHIAFLRMPPGTDDDIHRYVWDGRLQRLGYNPYLVIPNDPAVEGTAYRGNPQLE